MHKSTNHVNNPDFDSKRREKEAAIPVNKGACGLYRMSQICSVTAYFLLSAKIFFSSPRSNLLRVKSIPNASPMASEISLL